jgi:hypothetical protein
MVAPAQASGFRPGQRVRLLVAFLAWAERRGRDGKYDGTGGTLPTPDSLTGGADIPPAARFLATDEALTFVRHRSEVPGSCLVRDGSGAAWVCPCDYLAVEEVARV